jgi:TrmH family RNA methyltransferase
MEVVSSRKNPLVAEMRRVARADADAPGRMLLEGLHLVEEARTARLPLTCAAFSARVLADGDGRARRLATSLAAIGVRVVQVSDSVLDAMSPAPSPTGVVALATRPQHDLDAVLRRSAPALVSVLVDVQDPGNVGAIARVSEAAGVTGLIVCGASADPFGWKALRGSMGSAFRLPIAQQGDALAVLAAARAAGLQIVGTEPTRAQPFDRVDWRKPTAFVLGSEGAGLDEDVRAVTDLTVAIPMNAPVESLNVAVSAGLLAYEARRQRTHGAGAGS